MICRTIKGQSFMIDKCEVSVCCVGLSVVTRAWACLRNRERAVLHGEQKRMHAARWWAHTDSPSAAPAPQRLRESSAAVRSVAEAEPILAHAERPLGLSRSSVSTVHAVCCWLSGLRLVHHGLLRPGHRGRLQELPHLCGAMRGQVRPAARLCMQRSAVDARRAMKGCAGQEATRAMQTRADAGACLTQRCAPPVVLRSVFLRDCTNCNFAVVARQLRTRDIKDCNIALLCRTRPIVESSTNVRTCRLALPICPLPHVGDSCADGAWCRIYALQVGFACFNLDYQHFDGETSVKDWPVVRMLMLRWGSLHAASFWPCFACPAVGQHAPHQASRTCHTAAAQLPIMACCPG